MSSLSPSIHTFLAQNLSSSDSFQNLTIPLEVLSKVRQNAINQSTGIYFGTYMDLLLGGICAQLLLMYSKRPAPRAEAWIVYTAASVSTVGTAVHISHIEALLRNWGNPQAVATFYWQNPFGFVSNGAVLALIQSVYGYRLYKLWGSRYSVKVGLTMVVLAALSVNCAVTVLSVKRPRIYDNSAAIERWVKKMKWLVILMNVSNLVADAVMCVGCAHALHRARRHEIAEQTVHIVKRYIRLLLRAMALPTLFSVITLIVAEKKNTTMFFVATLWPLNKLALISLMSLLLARHELRLAFRPTVDLIANTADSGIMRDRNRHGKNDSIVMVATEEYTHASRDEFEMRETTNRARRAMLALG